MPRHWIGWMGIRSAGEQTGPGCGDVVGTAWPMVGMLEGVASELRHPGQVPAIASEQVVQIFGGNFAILGILLQPVCDDKLQALVARYAIRAPNIIRERHRVSVAVILRVSY